MAEGTSPPGSVDADAVAIVFVEDHALDLPADPASQVAQVAVVHEHPAPLANGWQFCRVVGVPVGERAHGQEHVRAGYAWRDGTCGSSRRPMPAATFLEQGRVCASTSGEYQPMPKPVAIDRRVAFRSCGSAPRASGRAPSLAFQRNRLTAIGNPSAHRVAPRNLLPQFEGPAAVAASASTRTFKLKSGTRMICKP